MKKLPLQIATAILGAIPVATGIIGLFGIHDPIYASAALPEHALLDSNLRFLSGIWLGLGLAVYWMLPNIAKHTTLFRALWGMIFIGGLGRLLSMFAVGWPPAPFIGFTVLEIVGAPLFVAWQTAVANRYGFSGLSRSS